MSGHHNWREKRAAMPSSPEHEAAYQQARLALTDEVVNDQYDCGCVTGLTLMRQNAQAEWQAGAAFARPCEKHLNPGHRALHAFVEDLAKNGLRFDLTPTVMGKDTATMYADMTRYLRRIETSIRTRAAAALAEE